MLSNYKEYEPKQPLNDYIECYWSLEVCHSKKKQNKEAMVPGGRVEFIFSSSPFLWYGVENEIKPSMYPDCIVLGQRNTVSYCDFQENCVVVGIRFRYGCAPLFLNCAAKHISNKVMPLSELSLIRAPEFEKIEAEENISKFIERVESWLLLFIKKPGDDWHKLQNILSDMSDAENKIKLGSLYEKHGWSHKKAERIFLKYIGFPPRNFFKILRFRNALEKMKSKTTSSLTDVAHRLGYYDQSHFIRDFYTYTGTNPSIFFKDPPEVAVILYKISR